MDEKRLKILSGNAIELYVDSFDMFVYEADKYGNIIVLGWIFDSLIEEIGITENELNDLGFFAGEISDC